MGRHPHRIIVEGMDGSGKTTFVERLIENVPSLEVVRNPRDDKQNFTKWWPAILDEEDNGHTPVHDRFFYSELVYGPIIRGRINAEPQLLSNVLWFLRSTALLVYARPNSDMIREGIRTNKHMTGVTDNFQPLLELYDQLMEAESSWYGQRFIHYVWNREGDFERVELAVRRYLSGGTK